MFYPDIAELWAAMAQASRGPMWVLDLRLEKFCSMHLLLPPSLPYPAHGRVAEQSYSLTISARVHKTEYCVCKLQLMKDRDDSIGCMQFAISPGMPPAQPSSCACCFQLHPAGPQMLRLLLLPVRLQACIQLLCQDPCCPPSFSLLHSLVLHHIGLPIAY